MTSDLTVDFYTSFEWEGSIKSRILSWCWIQVRRTHQSTLLVDIYWNNLIAWLATNDETSDFVFDQYFNDLFYCRSEFFRNYFHYYAICFGENFLRECDSCNLLVLLPSFDIEKCGTSNNLTYCLIVWQLLSQSTQLTRKLTFPSKYYSYGLETLVLKAMQIPCCLNWPSVVCNICLVYK